MKNVNIKKAILPNLPYAFIALYATKLGQAARLSPGADFSAKALHIMEGFAAAFQSALPSFHPIDLCVGVAAALLIRLAVYVTGAGKPSNASGSMGKPAAAQTPAATEPAKAQEPAGTAAPVTIEKGTGFSQNGSAVTRDLLYDKHTNKQFIAVETRNGHTLYLVIDYDKPLDEDGDQYETYFLNLVDESDLLALIDEDSAPVCSCKDKCEAGAVNTACAVCKTNMTECMGKEKVTEKMPEPDPTPGTTDSPDKDGGEKKSGSGLVVIVLLLLMAGGGALYWFKLRKKKPDTKGPVDLDDYDYGDEDEDEEYENEDDADEPEETEDADA